MGPKQEEPNLQSLLAGRIEYIEKELKNAAEMNFPADNPWVAERRHLLTELYGVRDKMNHFAEKTNALIAKCGEKINENGLEGIKNLKGIKLPK